MGLTDKTLKIEAENLGDKMTALQGLGTEIVSCSRNARAVPGVAGSQIHRN